MNTKDMIEAIKGMTVLELSNLVKDLEEEFGVSAAPAMMAGPMPAMGAAAAAEEQTAFEVVLKDAGSAKIGVIKVVKELMGTGLKESKELVDGAPSSLKKDVSKEEAESIKAKLEEAGATVELK